jgi:hypothetical protein
MVRTSELCACPELVQGSLDDLPWKTDVMLKHAMPRISDYLNVLSGAACDFLPVKNPGVSDELHHLFPEKTV